jgi:hypothetical protein
MIAAGVILAAVGLALGGFNSVRLGSQGFYVDSEPGLWGAKESLSKRFDQFENIDIDVAAYTVRLRKGDAYGMELKSRRARETPYIHAADGILTVRESKEDMRRRKGFLEGLLSVWPFGVVHSDWDDALIEITYPSGARFDAISIEAAAGNVDIVGLDADSLSVVCAAGNLEIENAKLGDLRVNLDLGECEIEDTRADGASVEMNAGSFSTKDFDCGPLRGDFHMGAADVEGTLRGDVDISADVGSVSVRTDLPKSEYRLDLDVSLGSVTVDGRTVSGRNLVDIAADADASASYDFRVRAAMGSVEIDFD